MIPDEAVEAAVKAVKVFFDGKPPRGTRAATRIALEAAAPHLFAEAWDEGMEAMYGSTSHEWPPIPEANPYRRTEGEAI